MIIWSKKESNSRSENYWLVLDPKFFLTHITMWVSILNKLDVLNRLVNFKKWLWFKAILLVAEKSWPQHHFSRKWQEISPAQKLFVMFEFFVKIIWTSTLNPWIWPLDKCMWRACNLINYETITMKELFLKNLLLESESK